MFLASPDNVRLAVYRSTTIGPNFLEISIDLLGRQCYVALPDKQDDSVNVIFSELT